MLLDPINCKVMVVNMEVEEPRKMLIYPSEIACVIEADSPESSQILVGGQLIRVNVPLQQMNNIYKQSRQL